MKTSKLYFPKSAVPLANMPDFRPIKGVAVEDFAAISYPCYATPKFDGIRAITRRCNQKDLFVTHTMEVLSYALKPIPNKFVVEQLRRFNIPDLDGELVTLDEKGNIEKYNPVQSAIMRSDGTPVFQYMVFDLISYDEYWERQEQLMTLNLLSFPFVQVVKPTVIPNAEALTAFEAECVLLGYEGVIVRSIDGLYKCGRSSVKEGVMLKIKRFKDAEATIIGFEELMHNDNDQTINPHGLAERSSHKANQRPGGTLGSLVCSGHNNMVFNIGSGFTHEERQDIWNNQDKYKLSLVKYKYQPHSMKDAPRSPIFLGFRSPNDL